MSKLITAAAAAAFLVLAAGSASAGSLIGQWVFHARAFQANGPAAPLHTGEFLILGTLTIEKQPQGFFLNVRGDFTFVGGDSGGNQVQCISSLAAPSEIHFLMHLEFTTANGCILGSGGKAAALDFGILPLHDGSFQLLMASFTPGSLTIGGKLIKSLVLDATIVRQGSITFSPPPS
jgi:hypothetical protein